MLKKYKLTENTKTELTPEQEAMIPGWIDKWVSVPTTPSTDDEIKNAVYTLCKGMKEYKDSPLPAVAVLDSPLACELMANQWVRITEETKLNKQLYDQLHSQLGSQLDGQLSRQLYRQLYDQLYRQHDSQLYDQLYDQLDGQLDGQLDSQQVKKCGYLNIFWLKCCGQYSFGKEIGVEFNQEAYHQFIEYNRHVTYVVPFQGLWLVSRKPVNIKWRDEKLHSDDGTKSVEFADGWGMYSFDGQLMPEKYGSRPISQWRPKWIDKEKNADIRTALLKGIGYDRWIAETGGKVVDEAVLYNLPYQLIIREDDNIGTMKFLKMKNPSVPGVFHIEPVAPYGWIQTCEDALNWRLGAESSNDKYKVTDIA